METTQFNKLIHTIGLLFDPQSFNMDDGVVADADSFSKPTIVRGTNVSLWAKGSGIDPIAAPKVSLQGCNFESTDNADWIDLADSEVTLAADATGYGSALIACCYKFVRRKFVANGGATGTFRTIINVNR